MNGPSSCPAIGDCYLDPKSRESYLWIGNKWAIYSDHSPHTQVIPTDEQLEKYPVLQQAWEEYTVIRKLLGL